MRELDQDYRKLTTLWKALSAAEQGAQGGAECTAAQSAHAAALYLLRPLSGSSFNSATALANQRRRMFRRDVVDALRSQKDPGRLASSIAQRCAAKDPAINPTSLARLLRLSHDATVKMLGAHSVLAPLLDAKRITPADVARIALGARAYHLLEIDIGDLIEGWAASHGQPTIWGLQRSLETSDQRAIKVPPYYEDLIKPQTLTRLDQSRVPVYCATRVLQQRVSWSLQMLEKLGVQPDLRKLRGIVCASIEEDGDLHAAFDHFSRLAWVLDSDEERSGLSSEVKFFRMLAEEIRHSTQSHHFSGWAAELDVNAYLYVMNLGLKRRIDADSLDDSTDQASMRPILDADQALHAVALAAADPAYIDQAILLDHNIIDHARFNDLRAAKLDRELLRP